MVMTVYTGEGREFFSGRPSTDYVSAAIEDRFRPAVREQPQPVASYAFALKMVDDIAGLDPVPDKDTSLENGRVSRFPTGFLDRWFE